MIHEQIRAVADQTGMTGRSNCHVKEQKTDEGPLSTWEAHTAAALPGAFLWRRESASQKSARLQHEGYTCRPRGKSPEIDKKRDEVPHIILLGDLNCKHRAWDKYSAPNAGGTLLCELLSEFTMTQCIDEVTRYSADGASRSVIGPLLDDPPGLCREYGRQRPHF